MLLSILLMFFFITYFCLSFIVSSKAELSPRGALHGILAFTIVVLLGVKITFLRFYRQFYNQVKILGLLIALITFGMVGTSGGYYFLVTELGTDKTFEKIMEYKKSGLSGGKMVVKTNPGSIDKGKNLFDSKCSYCHSANSTKTIVGPGLIDILKKPRLPVSRKQATPENVVNQIRNPYKDMPSFSYLSEDDMLNIIAFLNTL